MEEEIEGECVDESRVVKDSLLEKKADREVTEVDDLTNSVLSSSSIVAVVEGETESSENLLESSSGTELPVLTSGGETEDISAPNVDTEYIEDAKEGIIEESEDSSPVVSSVLDEGSIVERDDAKVENNTTTPEFLGKENAEEAPITEPIIDVPDNDILEGNAVTTDESPISEHKNVETEMQIETNEDGREWFDSNLVSPSPQSEPAIILSEETEEQNLQAETQKVEVLEMQKVEVLEMQKVETLEMQSVMSNGNASDTSNAEIKYPIMEDEASGAGSGMLDEAVEFLSEKDKMLVMTMPPRLEADSVLKEETGIGTLEESREDDVSENQNMVS